MWLARTCMRSVAMIIPRIIFSLHEINCKYNENFMSAKIPVLRYMKYAITWREKQDLVVCVMSSGRHNKDVIFYCGGKRKSV